jgi:two-component system, chemotaxis family, protein-glutamate methylesterase/glutaminase
MPSRDLIVVGGSAGAIDPLKNLIAGLPGNLHAAILVVQHLSPHGRSRLASVLSSGAALEVVQAEDGAPVVRGQVYLARPGCHLMLDDSRVRVVHGPKENRHRPSVDTLFRSAAWWYGPRVIGVVLSGSLDDGTAGLWAVKRAGGLAVVQDPREAAFPDMPSNAMREVAVDHVLPLHEIPALLVRLTRELVNGNAPRTPEVHHLEVESLLNEADIGDMNAIGKRTAFSCPACGGGLWEIDEGGIVRYRCHVGHAYSSQTLIADQSESVDRALESARRVMKENAAMLRRLIERLGDRAPKLSEEYAERLEALEADAAVLGTLTGRRPEALSGSVRTSDN